MAYLGADIVSCCCGCYCCCFVHISAYLVRVASSSRDWNFRLVPARTFTFGLVPARTTHGTRGVGCLYCIPGSRYYYCLSLLLLFSSHYCVLGERINIFQITSAAQRNPPLSAHLAHGFHDVILLIGIPVELLY